MTDFWLQPERNAHRKVSGVLRLVGRLNPILEPASCTPRVLLYYPIYDLWSEYTPPLPNRCGWNSDSAERLVRSIMHLGQTLQPAQIPFMLIDHENLSRAAVPGGGNWHHGPLLRARSLLPEGVELRGLRQDVVEKARQVGFAFSPGPGTSLKGRQPLVGRCAAARYPIAPASAAIALGEFVRDGRSILLTVNVGRQPYEGHFAAAGAGGCARWTRATARSAPPRFPYPAAFGSRRTGDSHAVGAGSAVDSPPHHTPALCTARR